MLFLIFGFLSLVLFIFIGLVTLNYSIYLWENQRINDLASQVRREKIDEILQRRKEKEFTSQDLNKNYSNNFEVINSTNRDLVISGNENQETDKQPFSVQKIIDLSKKTFLFLIHLANPPKAKNYDPINEARQKEIEDTISKFSARNSDYAKNDDFSSEDILEDDQSSGIKINKTKPLTNLRDFNSFENDDFEEEDDFSSNSIKNDKNSEDDFTLDTDINDDNEVFGATLNFAANDSKEDLEKQKKQSLFKKLENKILDNLKSKGLNHYDIWLELAQLYERYGQQKKAIEVYAMILKHSKSKEKDIAKNKLIALT